MIDLQNIGKQYGANRVLDNVSLSIAAANFLCWSAPAAAAKARC